MKNRSVLLAVLAAVCHAMPAQAALPAESKEVAAAAPWELVSERASEVGALYAFLQKTHPNLYKKVSKQDFDAAVAKLQSDAPRLDWPHYVMGIYSLLALTGDGHTSMYPLPASGPGFETRYPFLTEAFADGIYVVAASKPFANLVGKKLLSIDGMTVDAIGTKLSSYWPHNNLMWVERWFPTMLRRPGYLAGTDLIRSIDTPIAVEVAGSGGKKLKMKVAPVTVKDDLAAQANWIRVRDPQAEGPTPAHNDGKPFSFAIIDGGRSVYATYRQSGDGENETVADFAKALYAAVADPKVQKLILDIRENGGGDNSFNYPVQLGALEARNVNRPGGLYVLIGRETFSAAQNIATFLERYSEATFVGEPTGSAPNHYGDLVLFEAPVSKLSIIVSTVPWQDSSPHDKRHWIMPDIAAKPTFADYAAGRDPALEAALADTKGREPTRAGDSWRRASQNGEWKAAWQR